MFNSATIIMVSGGVDSTYLLYKQLTETDDNIHAHHIHFKPHKNFIRDDVEAAATARVYKYLLKNIRNFSFSSSVLDLSHFPYTGWDTDSQLFIASRIAPSLNANHVDVMLGINKDDRELPEVQDRIERNVLPNLWEALIASLDEWQRVRISSSLTLPLANVTKKEIIKALPKELLDLTWSCREPIRDNNGVHRCGNCHACKQLKI